MSSNALDAFDLALEMIQLACAVNRPDLHGDPDCGWCQGNGWEPAIGRDHRAFVAPCSKCRKEVRS